MYMEYEFEAYVRKSIRNAAINYGKAKDARTAREVSIEDYEQHLVHLDVYFSSFDAFDTVVLIEDADIADALSNLNDTTRLVVLAYYFLGFNDADIARLLGLPRKTVNTIRHRGLAQLRKELSHE